MSLVSVNITEVTGKIVLVPRYILKIKECHVTSVGEERANLSAIVYL